MELTLSQWQKSPESLLNQYENSKTYREKIRSRRHFPYLRQKFSRIMILILRILTLCMTLKGADEGIRTERTPLLLSEKMV